MKRALITISRLTGIASIVLMFLATTAIVASAQTFTTLLDFDGANGSLPEASLIQASDGNFYGTTYRGGTHNFGTVFQMTPGGTLTTLYNFCPQSGCADGSNPVGQLVQGTDGNFYGTTNTGGANTYALCSSGCGTVFKLTPTGTLTTLYSFCSQTDCTDGAVPYAGLVQGTDGNFYGTTYDGGSLTLYGSVFEITPSGTLTTLHSFCSDIQNGQCVDGYNPRAGLTPDAQGNLYGTTFYGGTYGVGAIFRITTGGVLTTVYSFCPNSGGCPDGFNPDAILTLGTDGNFYSTTYVGGANEGTVFKVTPSGILTTLYSFNGTDGSTPVAGVVEGADGNFYGTTNGGGVNNWGTVFEITPAGTLTTLHSFDFNDGRTPNLGLVLGTDGKFYGVSSYGGTSGSCTNGCGTIYSLQVAQATVTLSPTSLTFANQAIATTSAAKSITLTNTGTIAVAISSVAINGDFAVSANTCGTTLAVGKMCKISVTFTPKQLGPSTGTLTLTDNAADSPQTVPLSGTGVLPATLTPVTAMYAAQEVGTTSAPKTFTLTNNQTIALTSIAISTTGDFAVSSTACTTSLAPKSKCTISVTFSPTTTGNRTGQLSVSDSADNSPQTVKLTGTGFVPATLTPASAAYAAQAEGTTSLPKTFTLTNNQTVTLTGIAISTTGDFAVSATTCTTSLAAKAKCTISVTFTPTAIGTRAGQLSVSDSASNSPQTSNLTGTGITPATLTPASATYVAQKVGTTSLPKTFTLTNNETVPLTGIAITTTGDFAVSATTCTTSLAAKAKCTIGVTFTPTVIGKRTGQLSVADSAVSSPQTSNLTGTGK